MLKVLFINAVDPASEVENRYRPLWPAYLAAYAEKQLGPGKIEFRFMTQSIAAELSSFNPHVVAIGSVSQNFPYAVEYARSAKQSGAAVIMGGIHISCLFDCLTEHMDVGCIGEGEETFCALIRSYLLHGSFLPEQLQTIEGIVFHGNGRPVKTEPRALTPALDNFPHPQRSLIGYQAHDYLFTSRGCPYRCVFCASSRFWDKVRFASPEYVLEEIRELIGHGVKMISFYDDLFVADKQRLKRIADLIVMNGYHRQVKFTCSCRANLVTPDVVACLKAMNVVSVGMGLESGCEGTLNYLKGRISVRDNKTAIELLKDAGIQANASFVIGSPGETEADILETYEFIRTSRLDFFDVYVLTPLPGTPIWDHAREKGLVSDSMDWSRLNVNFEVNARSAVIMSEKLDRKDLVRLYRKFRRLRLVHIVKALPTSPWMKDVPRVAVRLVAEKIKRFAGRVLSLSKST